MEGTKQRLQEDDPFRLMNGRITNLTEELTLNYQSTENLSANFLEELISLRREVLVRGAGRETCSIYPELKVVRQRLADLDCLMTNIRQYQFAKASEEYHRMHKSLDSQE